MTAARLIISAVLASSVLMACSSSRTAAEIETKLKQATIAATRSTMNAVVVVVSQQETASRWIWKATVEGKAYACDVDTFFELPDCQPATQSGAQS